jgi:heterodisulfide reductase subunit C
MDYTPRQLWRLVQVGLRDEALHSRTFWLCTNCYSCTVRCPRGIALTETMAALKRLAIAENVEGKEKEHVSHFYRAFMETVRRHGRNFEPELLLRYFLRTNPLGLVGQAPLGLTMWQHRRIALTPRHNQAQHDVDTIFRKALELDAGRQHTAQPEARP